MEFFLPRYQVRGRNNLICLFRREWYNIPAIIGLRCDAHPLVLQTVRSRCLLVLWTHESAEAPFVDNARIVRPAVEKELDHRWILVHDSDVQDIFP